MRIFEPTVGSESCRGVHQKTETSQRFPFFGTPGGIRFRSLNRRLSRLERARCSFRANELSSFAVSTPHWGDIRIVRPRPTAVCPNPYEYFQQESPPAWGGLSCWHTRRDSKSATDIGVISHCGARFLSVEKGTDEISATGGRQCLSHSLPLRRSNRPPFGEIV